MTDAPRISDEEAHALWDHVIKHGMNVRSIQQALAAFLSARVPDAKPVDFHKPGMGPLLSGGEWNACRDAVLRGKE